MQRYIGNEYIFFVFSFIYFSGMVCYCHDFSSITL